MLGVIHYAAVGVRDFVHQPALQERGRYLPFAADKDQDGTVFLQKCGVFVITLWSNRAQARIISSRERDAILINRVN